MLDRIMDGEDRSIAAGERQQPRIEVLVNVHDLWPPSAKLSSYLKHRRDGGDGPDATGNDEQVDTFAPKDIDDLVALRRRPSELQRVRAGEHADVVTDLS